MLQPVSVVGQIERTRRQGLPVAAPSSENTPDLSAPTRRPRLAMADTPEKKSVEATSDQPRLTGNDNNSSDADKDLAAMGYKPVSRLQS